MKRVTKAILSAGVALAVLAGCSAQGQGGVPAAEEGKVNVVTTFFPLYDFARTIGGEHANVVNMIPAGVEPHDWTPKSQDMLAIQRAQVFIYQGAGFEGWTDTVLGGIANESLVIVEASRGIELLETADSDGHDDHDHDHSHEAEAQADDHDHDHSHEAEAGVDEHGHDHAHEADAGADEHADEAEAHAVDDAQAEHAHHHDHGAYDPHTWLSPRSALTMAANVLEGLKLADPAHAAAFEANFEELKAELESLDQAYASRLSAVPNKEMVVSHQAFGYLARDYGLVQMPMMGITPDGEPTAQDLKAISEFVREHGVKYIFTEELVSDRLAKTLANDLGVDTLPLHPLEGLTEEEQAAGETYISLMLRNLEHLEKALKE